MPKYTNETESFRHRGYADAVNNKEIMIFGDGPEPVDANGVILPKLWDHLVVSVTTVTDYVDPATLANGLVPSAT